MVLGQTAFQESAKERGEWDDRYSKKYNVKELKHYYHERDLYYT